jgi:hypothetical protein
MVMRKLIVGLLQINVLILLLEEGGGDPILRPLACPGLAIFRRTSLAVGETLFESQTGSGQGVGVNWVPCRIAVIHIIV